VTDDLSILLEQNLSIERYLPTDLDELMAIEQKSFEMPWSRTSYEELAPMEGISIWVARLGGRLVGYMLLQHVVDALELHTFAVTPKLRNQGIGTRLMEHLLQEAKRLHVQSVFLQVRPTNNAARRIYQKLGFQVVGTRCAYYSNDGEDALVLRLMMGEGTEALK